MCVCVCACVYVRVCVCVCLNNIKNPPTKMRTKDIIPYKDVPCMWERGNLIVVRD